MQLVTDAPCQESEPFVTGHRPRVAKHGLIAELTLKESAQSEEELCCIHPPSNILCLRRSMRLRLAHWDPHNHHWNHWLAICLLVLH